MVQDNFHFVAFSYTKILMTWDNKYRSSKEYVIVENTKETILIVDDSRFQRAVIRETFKEKFRIMEAASGEECLQIIGENPDDIDLVLLDLVMPGIDGFEVLRRRRQMQSFSDIPVIVLTTSDRSEIQANAYELGANDFLTKPLNESTAIFRIQNLLGYKNRVTTLVKKYDEYRTKAEIDGMTGFFNKTATVELISNILTSEANQRHALLAIDIDNFKAVNDVYGHTVGDHTISIVASAIASRFTGSDICGRVGGDEFVVFVRDVVSKQEVYEKIQNVMHLISGNKELSIPENITLSIGLVFSDGTEQDYAQLYAKADEALYISKNSGKARYTEYGRAERTDMGDKNVLVLTGSRNVASMIEFAYDAAVRIHTIATSVQLAEAMDQMDVTPMHVYADISTQKDEGQRMLETIGKSSLAEGKVIVICREGDLAQVRQAVSYPFVCDLIFEPIEPQQLKRRVAALNNSVS